MSTQAGDDAELAVRDALVAELAVLRARLRGEPVDEAEAALARARERLADPTPLDRLAGGFGLSEFERAVLLLTAGPELIAAVADDLEAAGGVARLTFGTALSVLPGAHWSALTPAGPLRRWELVQLLDPLSPVRSPLVVDERVLHHLVGAGVLDPRLAVHTRPVSPPAWLPAPLEALAAAVLDTWLEGRVVLLSGPQPGNARSVAAAAGRRGGLEVLQVAAADVCGGSGDVERVLRWMERETVLGAVGWLVDVTDLPAADEGRFLRHVESLDAPVALVGCAAATAPGARVDVLPVPRLGGADRSAALAHALRKAAGERSPEEEVAGGLVAGLRGPDRTGRGRIPSPNGLRVPDDVRDAAGVFDLPLDLLDRVAQDVVAGEQLWRACRRRGRSVTGALAEVLEPRTRWDDLVLPPAQLQQLRALVARVRHRARVLEDWGFEARSSRGLGTVALFSGPSGTGKTLAAEVVANELALDLVRVDLSQVMSKYIGETEKHLGALFDAAENGGAVLLFDEADTLFGKRSEVRDSHDRYANVEVGYLLQRVESFRGLAVLTTNNRSTLDPAFTRRIGTIVTFPYPDPSLRRRLWEGAFPAETPVDGLDGRRLADVDLPGGGIAAAAIGAAYLAADDDTPVSRTHLETATRWELAKVGRSMPGTNGGTPRQR